MKTYLANVLLVGSVDFLYFKDMLLNFFFVSVFSTCFIEYQFPVVATSRDKYLPNAMATEVMRVVSRNEKSGGQCINRKQIPYSKYTVALGLQVGCVLYLLNISPLPAKPKGTLGLHSVSPSVNRVCQFQFPNFFPIRLQILT